MNVRVNLNYPIYDGAEIVFKAPCDASEVTGLIVYYPGGVDMFSFADAHTNDLGHIDELFAAGAVVKVILDTDAKMAFVQNAVTNAYLEKKFSAVGGSTEHYYESLYQAIVDINSGAYDHSIADVSAAKVKVFNSNSGVLTVALLGDITESVNITVSKSLQLVLAGHNLTFTNDGFLTFAEGTDCSIDGSITGSAIVRHLNLPSTNAYLVRIDCKTMYIKGGTYSLSGESKVLPVAFRIGSDNTCCEVDGCEIILTNSSLTTSTTTRAVQSQSAKLILRGTTITTSCETTSTAAAAFVDSVGIVSGSCEIENCSISSRGCCVYAVNKITATSADITIRDSNIGAVSTQDGGFAIAVLNHSSATTSIENSYIFADARGDDTGEEVSRGIANQGTLYIKNSDVIATYAAVHNHGKLYVNGGSYKGYSHGGFYFTHGANGIAYINDATIMCGGYEGEYADVFAGDTVEVLGGFYVGGTGNALGSNMSIYIDGCTIDGSAGSTGFVLRNTYDEANNTVYISNSNVSGIVRIDDGTHSLQVGIGTNITDGGINNPAYAEFTNELYRNQHEDYQLTGKDLSAIVSYIKSVPSGDEVSY